MLQLTPRSRIFLAVEPVDFRAGIDRLAAFCRQQLAQNPREGAVYVFRNRRSTTLKRTRLGPSVPVTQITRQPQQVMAGAGWPLRRSASTCAK